ATIVRKNPPAQDGDEGARMQAAALGSGHTLEPAGAETVGTLTKPSSKAVDNQGQNAQGNEPASGQSAQDDESTPGQNSQGNETASGQNAQDDESTPGQNSQGNETASGQNAQDDESTPGQNSQ